MPFQSFSQLRTCYGKKSWNCDEWLQETLSVCYLPEKKGGPKNNYANDMPAKRIVSDIKTGPKGGQFFTIEEKNKRGKTICKKIVYVK